MEFFQKAKYVRIRSHHGKYLWANDDGASVSQSRDGGKQNAKWKVEIVEGKNLIRLKSCHDCYLTASSILFLLGTTGRKVLQTIPLKLDSSVEWEPIKEGYQAKLRASNGNYLRANGGIPPWRNSVTHDSSQRTATQNWTLWDVEITEIQMPSSLKELKEQAAVKMQQQLDKDATMKMYQT
uniref:DUF569 domain-containing protein n=1 Tax=Araucaria cunninghamii TaxID=56994 RepID=A0A0D6QZY5_ARACU